MQEEKRTGKSSGLDDLEAVLNEAQLLMLGKMRELGWELKFVRRPMMEDTVPVLFHPDGSEYGILESDGSLNTQTNISVRETDQTVLIACPSCGYMVYGRLWRCPGCGGTGSIYR